ASRSRTARPRYLNARIIVSSPGALPRERRAIHRRVALTFPRKRAVAFLSLILKNSDLSRGTIVHQKFSSVMLWLSLLPALCVGAQPPAGAPAPVTAIRAGKFIDVQAE